MIFNRGDIIETSVHGFLTVEMPFTIKENKNPKYDKLGGRTLYWLKNTENVTILLWDTELAKVLIEDQNLNKIYEESEIDQFFE